MHGSDCLVHFTQAHRLRNSPLYFLLCDDEEKLLRTKQVVARARLRITPYWQAMAKTHSICPKRSQPRQSAKKRESGKKLYAIRIELQLAQKESLISMKFLFVGGTEILPRGDPWLCQMAIWNIKPPSRMHETSILTGGIYRRAVRSSLSPLRRSHSHSPA